MNELSTFLDELHCNTLRIKYIPNTIGDKHKGWSCRIKGLDDSDTEITVYGYKTALGAMLAIKTKCNEIRSGLNG